MLFFSLTDNPHVVATRKKDLGDSANVLTCSGKHLQTNHLIIIKFPLANWGEPALLD
jgi:hypothetical protein